jgi:hypothetical protein
MKIRELELGPDVRLSRSNAASLCRGRCPTHSREGQPCGRRRLFALGATTKALNYDDSAGEDDAERDQVAPTDHDTESGHERVPFDGLVAGIQVAEIRDRPVVITTDAEDGSGRDYPDKAHPEEDRLLFLNAGHAQGERLLRGSDAASAVGFRAYPTPALGGAAEDV